MCHRLPIFQRMRAMAGLAAPAGAILRADDVSVAVVDGADGAMNAHHVVVIGAGFGGLETVHRLAGRRSASRSSTAATIICFSHFSRIREYVEYGNTGNTVTPGNAGIR